MHAISDVISHMNIHKHTRRTVYTVCYEYMRTFHLEQCTSLKKKSGSTYTSSRRCRQWSHRRRVIVHNLSGTNTHTQTFIYVYLPRRIDLFEHTPYDPRRRDHSQILEHRQTHKKPHRRMRCLLFVCCSRLLLLATTFIHITYTVVQEMICFAHQINKPASTHVMTISCNLVRIHYRYALKTATSSPWHSHVHPRSAASQIIRVSHVLILFFLLPLAALVSMRKLCGRVLRLCGYEKLPQNFTKTYTCTTTATAMRSRWRRQRRRRRRRLAVAVCVRKFAITPHTRQHARKNRINRRRASCVRGCAPSSRATSRRRRRRRRRWPRRPRHRRASRAHRKKKGAHRKTIYNPPRP